MKNFLIKAYRKLPYRLRALLNISGRLQKRIIVVGGKIQYGQDGLYTTRNSDFNNSSSKLRESFEESCRITGFDHPGPWRVYVCCWAMNRAVKELDGDLVECGVWRGTTSYAGLLYSEWDKFKKDKKLWLIDSWEGLDENLLLRGEDVDYSENTRSRYSNVFPDVKRTFGQFGQIKLTKGYIPEILKEVGCDKISYLHIDLNSAQPELEAIQYFWSKLVPGAVVVFDDYGFINHTIQKEVIDKFCMDINIEVLSLPTGQGLIVKA